LPPRDQVIGGAILLPQDTSLQRDSSLEFFKSAVATETKIAARALRKSYACARLARNGAHSHPFDQVKHLLRSKDERTFTPVGGVEGVYSMKRLGTS
jgi:hypothetical protein